MKLSTSGFGQQDHEGMILFSFFFVVVVVVLVYCFDLGRWNSCFGLLLLCSLLILIPFIKCSGSLVSRHKF